MENTEVVTNYIEVNDLSLDHLNDMVSDVLHLPKSQTASLSSLVYNKTQGNPLYTIEFLKSLHQDELLHFSHGEHRWKWDLNKISSHHFADDLADLMTNKILKLDAGTRNVLEIASCIESPFSLSTLKLLQNDQSSIGRAVSEGIFIPVFSRKAKYRFAHGEIHWAVHSLIQKPEHKSLHLRIGKSLRESYSEQELQNKIFEIANHLNSGLDLLQNEKERLDLARINLQAGNKAKLSGAFEPASNYFSTGIDLLHPNHRWNTHYELTLQLFTAAAETYYCLQNLPRMEKTLETFFEKATSFLHKIDGYLLQIKALNDVRKHREAVNIGLFALSNLGEHFPENPTESIVLPELEKTKLLLNGETREKMRIMDKPVVLAAMRVLSDVVSTCEFSNPSLKSFLGLRMIQLTLKHGVCKYSAYAFAFYGVLLCKKLGDMKEGYKYGQLALNLLEQFRAKEWLPKVYCSIYMFIYHWNEHVHLSLRPLLRSYRIALESGMNDISVYCANKYCLYAFFSGRPLEKLEEEMNILQQVLYLKTKAFSSCHQAVINLHTFKSKLPSSLAGDIFNLEEQLADKDDHGGTFISLELGVMLGYLFNDHETAVKWAEESFKLLNFVNCTFVYSISYFYNGLLAFEMRRKDPHNETWLQHARESIQKMKKWSNFAPENYLNKLCLLQAEMAALDNDIDRAVELYNESIAMAKENNFLHEEGLACERALAFYYEMDPEKAASHFSRACNAYGKWGAKAKVMHLKSLYPKLSTNSTEIDLPMTSVTGLDLALEQRSYASVSELSGTSYMHSYCSGKKRSPMDKRSPMA